MANESIVAVPPNVSEPVVLFRFLNRLVEQLDIVLGNRAGRDGQYVSQGVLLSQSEQLTADLEQARKALSDALLNVEQINRAIADQSTTRFVELDNRVDTLENAGYITDAPSDGNTYGRKDGAWVVIP